MRRARKFVPFEEYTRALEQEEKARRPLKLEDDRTESDQLAVAFLTSLFPDIAPDTALDVVREAGSVNAAVERLLSFDNDDDDDNSGGDTKVEELPPLSDAARRVLEVLGPNIAPNVATWAVERCAGDVDAAVELLLDEGVAAEMSASVASNVASARARNWAAFSQHHTGRPSPQVLAELNAGRGGEAEEDAAIAASRPMTLAARIKLEQLQRKYPSIDKQLLEDAFVCSHERVSDTLSVLAELFPELFPQSSRSTSTASTANATAPRPGTVIDVSVQRPASPTRRPPSPTAVEDAKRSAERLRSARDKLYRQAAEAFQRGDGAAARSLADAGRRQDALLRNMRSVVVAAASTRKRPKRAIDLHGLTVDEATAALDAIFKSDSAAPAPPHSLVIITGIGRHSAGEPKLLPAVREYLTCRNTSFVERSGFFIVKTNGTRR